MRNFRYLHIWQRSYQFTLEIYKHTKTFPKDELYGLVSQIRRSSADNHLMLSKDLNYISEEDYEILNKELDEIKKMISS